MTFLQASLIITAVWISIAASAAAPPALEYEVIAMLKDDSISDPEADVLPGMELTGDSEKDWVWRRFERASIGETGTTVFRAVGSGSFREGIWTGVADDFELIGRVGLPTSDGSADRFDAMRAP